MIFIAGLAIVVLVIAGEVLSPADGASVWLNRAICGIGAFLAGVGIYGHAVGVLS